MNIDSFRNYVEVMGLAKQATAPFVYRHCSTQRVLTMERLYGVPLTDLNSIRSIVPSPEATLITALNVWSVPFISLILISTLLDDKIHIPAKKENLQCYNDADGYTCHSKLFNTYHVACEESAQK